MNENPWAIDVVPEVPLEAVLSNHELDRRPAHPSDYRAETRALTALAQALADSPGTILQVLADTILSELSAESAGVSLLTDGDTRFYWPAIAGLWKEHIGSGTPRAFGPCGDVLQRNAPLLFNHFERRYTYFQSVTPLINECLLIPFYVNGEAVGTIWAINHDPHARPFDREDLRLLQSLSQFASAAYRSTRSLGQLEHQSAAQREANAALLVSSVRQHQLTEQAEQAVRRLALLQQVTAALSEAVEPVQVANVMVTQGVAALGAVDGTMLLLDDAEQVLVVLRSTVPMPVAHPGEQFELSLDVPAADALRLGRPIWIVSREYYLERYPHLAKQIGAWGHQASVVLPLLDKGRKLGVLVFNFDDAPAFSGEDQDYTLTLAGLCAQALERARLYEGEQKARAELETRVLARTAELENSSAQLRALAARLNTAREEERARVSRELHDQLGGALTALRLDIARIHQRGVQGETHRDLRPLLTAVDETLQLTRRLATELRPSVLDHLGLAAALEWQLQEFAAHSGVHGRFTTNAETVKLDPDAATGLFRIFQEALTNVARHAEATEVNVQLMQAAGMLVLRVHDNGRGLTTGALSQRASLGLVGMRERVRLLSGELAIHSEVGQGTVILVKVPLSAPQA